MESAKPYILFAQCNLWKSPNASTELGMYLNKSLSHYRYVDKDRAGFYVDGNLQDDAENYRQRLRNVGVTVNHLDEVIASPDEGQRRQFKASYKKEQAKLARQRQDLPPSQTGAASQAFVRALPACVPFCISCPCVHARTFILVHFSPSIAKNCLTLG